MSAWNFTVHEKLAEVERLIEFGRATRGAPGSEGHRTYEILKSVASDLRARLDAAPSVAFVEINRRVDAVARSGSLDHYNRVMSLGNEVLARWPVVSQALEMFGTEVERKEVA